MHPLAIEAGRAAISTGMGIATANWQDKRQLKQQQKLQELQMSGQRRMGQFNQQLALDMWERTNFEAQRKQLEKAGLNPGLLYGMGGSGGTTAAVPPGNVTGGNAPTGGGEIGMGLQLGLQAAMQQATIELTKAQTEKTKAETTKTAGVDTTLSQTITEQLKQITSNAKVQAELMELDKKIKTVETNIKEWTQQDVVDTIRHQENKIEQELRSVQAQGEFDEQTLQTKIIQTKAAAVEQTMRIALQKAGLQINTAQLKQINETTTAIITERKQSWEKLSLQEKETAIHQKLSNLQEQQTLFNTSDANWVKQVTSIFTDILKAF